MPPLVLSPPRSSEVTIAADAEIEFLTVLTHNEHRLPTESCLPIDLADRSQRQIDLGCDPRNIVRGPWCCRKDKLIIVAAAQDLRHARRVRAQRGTSRMRQRNSAHADGRVHPGGVTDMAKIGDETVRNIGGRVGNTSQARTKGQSRPGPPEA